MSLFERKDGRLPVWFMRQAGRYHSHYQAIRKNHDFDELCKNPELSCHVTMGPIQEFDFDAAILFSDLLYPLEQLGLGLSYATGKPTLDKRIETLEDAKQLQLLEDGSSFYQFQNRACQLIRNDLPAEKNLIGFVGAPFTLFTYAVHGTHAGNLLSAKTGLYDGRFEHFSELLIPELITEMSLQADGGADTIAIFDTAVGELALTDFVRFIVPLLQKITKAFKEQYPEKKIIYYSKHTTMNHLLSIEDENIDVLGVDYRHSLIEAMEKLGDDYYLQGNIDPCWLHLPWDRLKENLDQYFSNILRIDKWICGLGHGVLVGTPEENVLKTVQYIHSLRI